jgi:HPt (histidine-containing phosphotransfer) domain-containing protein
LNPPEFDDAALKRLKRMISASRAEEVLTLYLELTPTRMAAVHVGLRDNVLKGVGRALHDMKSSAGMIGARRLERLALEMEQDVARENCPALTAKAELLANAVSEAQRWVAERRLEA